MAGSADKKLIRSKSGLRIVALSDSCASPFLIKEPDWIPDKECKECMSCRMKYTFIIRRHHCRRCGQCFCGECCHEKQALPRMCFVDPVRLCTACAEITKKENAFFDKHLKVLLTGGHFYINGASEEESDMSTYHCKLTSDHRFLHLECLDNDLKCDPIDLQLIQTMQILRSDSNLQGGVPQGILITYQEADGSDQSIKLITPDTASKKQSMLWTVAMQKALKMVSENKDEIRQMTP